MINQIQAMARACGSLCAACTVLALGAPPAGAVAVTLGPVDLSPADPFAQCGLPAACQTKVYVPTAAPGATLVAPADGTITEWRVKGAPPARLFLRVVRETGGRRFEAVARSGKAKESSGIGATPAAIRITAGDQLGIELETNFPAADPTTTLLGDASAPGGTWSGFTAGLPAGATASPIEIGVGSLPLFNATVELDEPRIELMSSAQGSQSGGDVVVLTGRHLAVVRAVRFGSAQAEVIKTDNNQIIAISPSHDPGVVEVTVETAGGTSSGSSGDLYTYIADPLRGTETVGPPKIWRLRLSPKVFRAARRSNGAKGSTAIGTRITYRSSRVARTKFRIQKRAHKRWVWLRGSFIHRAQPGLNSIRFWGRLRGRTLTSGRYRMSARSVDSSKAWSNLIRRRFQITTGAHPTDSAIAG